MMFARRYAGLALLALLAVPPQAAATEPEPISKISSAAGTLAETSKTTPASAAQSVPSAPVHTPSTTPPAVSADTAPEAPAAPKPIPVTLNIDIDLAAQRLVVKAHGKPLHTWAISSGTREFPTPTGTFRPQWMAKMWFSRKYDDAPMPHSIFFKDGAAIHGTQSISRLGSAASHGCVRLAPANAAALYALVSKHGMLSTRIAVHGTPKWREPAVASRTTSRYAAADVRPLPVRPYGYAGYGRVDPYAQARPVQTYAPPSSGFIYPGDGPRYVQMRRPVYINSGRY